MRLLALLVCAAGLCAAQAQIQPVPGMRIMSMPLFQAVGGHPSPLGDCDCDETAPSARLHHSLLGEAFGGAPAGGHYTVRLLPASAGPVRLSSLLDELLSGNSEGEESSPAVAPRRAASPFSGPFSAGPLSSMGAMMMMGGGGAMPMGRSSSMTHITMHGDKIDIDTTTTDAKGHQQTTHTTDEAKGDTLDKTLKAALGGPAGEMSGLAGMIEGLLQEEEEAAPTAPAKPAAQPEEEEKEEDADAADSDEGDEDEDEEEADANDEDEDEDDEDEQSLDEEDQNGDDDEEDEEADDQDDGDADDEDEGSPFEVTGKDLDSLDDSTKDAVKGAVSKAIGAPKEAIKIAPTAAPQKKSPGGSSEEMIAAEIAKNKAAAEQVKQREAETLKELKKVEGTTAASVRSASQKAEEMEESLGRLALMQKSLERQQQAVVA